MNFSTISILLPTRGRVQRLDRALKSIRSQAHDPSKIEIIFRCDHDDEETQRYLREHKEFFLVGPREKGYASLPKFMNQCASASTGDIIMMLNDDIIVETQNWDLRLLDFANKFQDGIFDIGIGTGLNDNLFPFSIISRLAYRALGFVNDERLVFSDIFILDVMNSFGRAIRLPSVKIIHEWAGNDTSDITRIEASKHENNLVFDGTPGDANDHKKNWQKSYKDLHEKAVREAVEKLKAALLDKEEASREPAISNHISLKSTRIAQGVYPDKLWDSLIARLNLKENIGQSALIAPLRDREIAKTWGQIFGEVIGLEYSPTVDASSYYSPEWYHNVKIFKGPIARTEFLFHFRDICLGPQSRVNSPFNCLIIENEQYPVSSYPISMAVYYVLRKVLAPSASIVFIHGGKTAGTHANNDQLVRHLEDAIDGYRHSIESFRDSKTGAGFSVEIYDPLLLRKPSEKSLHQDSFEQTEVKDNVETAQQ